MQHNGKNVVIDCGPDFRQQALTQRIKRLDAVIFTHEHKDHVGGLDDIRPYNFQQAMDIPVFASNRVVEHLRLEYPYIFAENKYPGIPKIQIVEINGRPFEVAGIDFIPIQVYHHKLPVWGFRINDFTYITDANFIGEQEKTKIKGSKTLVLNALQIDPHISHYNLDEALELVKELQPDTAYFTHISHRLGLHQEITDKIPENVQLAYDGLTLRI
ncbi:MAG: MBL fold metallo-hydrolase [Cyclobacteriaceae bacterium]|nr:MAG: MBL fold metallo-hydrolase [Cyclobacteriaceae bacterium]